MQTIHVQFDDETQARIVAAFASPQSAQDYPYMAEVGDEDPRYLEFLKRQSGGSGGEAANTYERDRLLSAATLAIAPLQDAVDLEDATAKEIALLKKWKQYRVAVNRTDLTVDPAVWPKAPQSN